MSLVLRRTSGESFVLIDENDPESFALVTVHIEGGQVKVAVDAPKNVAIIRREILHRYAARDGVRAALERMERERIA